MNFEQLILKIITQSGDAKSYAMEAIQYAKQKDFSKAQESIERVNEKLREAHREQTTLIQNEAQGNKTEVTLLLIHAQDHLMNAITLRDMAKEFIELYERVL